MMLEVLRQDYIRTAWSKGLRERVVVSRHALKNAFIPVITLIGLEIPVLVGGTIIIEQIFALPGIGLLTLDALSRRDYTVVSGLNLMIAVFILIINLVVDLTYGWFDPRVRYE
jgi:peptide/nickel transport system permease protein